MSRTLLLAGNWKMNHTLASASELVRGLRDGLHALSGANRVEVLICPPTTTLHAMAQAVAGSSIALGAQNCHEDKSGAFTGEVSAAMVKDVGCSYVIIGHSERRQLFGERNDRLARKVRAVQGAGLRVIYCVGETLEERDAGHMEAVLTSQMREVINAEVSADALVVAYEPVWAIGTGRTASAEQAQGAHALIRAELAKVYGATGADGIRVLYGGSVKASNAGELLSQPDVDGALVGGASLVATDFLGIIEAGVALSGS